MFSSGVNLAWHQNLSKTVNIKKAPIADFTYSINSSNCMMVIFTDRSTDSDGTIESRLWNFGDGNTSTAQNPSHTYAEGGTYTVTLTVTDNDGCMNSISKTVNINKDPIADFTYSSNCPFASFTDRSTDSDENIVSWLWDFGDGRTSTDKDPIHNYGTAGTYNVTLTVTDNCEAQDSVAKFVFVSAYPVPSTVTASNVPPRADFTFTNDGLTVIFTDQSSDSDGTILSWSWDFDDGDTSTALNVGHTFMAAGSYTVTLRVTDNDGAYDSISQAVTVYSESTAHETEFIPGANGLAVDFTDGNREPDPGTVNLTVSDGGGVLDYCPSTSSSADPMAISQVDIASFINSSGKNTYSDFNDMTIHVQDGQKPGLRIHTGRMGYHGPCKNGLGWGLVEDYVVTIK